MGKAAPELPMRKERAGDRRVEIPLLPGRLDDRTEREGEGGGQEGERMYR